MQYTATPGGPFVVRNVTRNICALLACMGALALIAPQCQAQDINVNVNGNPVSFAGMGPIQVNGRVLVPIRGVLENLGADVGWSEETQTVIASHNGVNIRLRIGDHRAMVNGRPQYLDTPAREIAGHTMVPLRFLSEALGAEVKWDNQSGTVNIVTHGDDADHGGHRDHHQRFHDRNHDDRNHDQHDGDKPRP